MSKESKAEIEGAVERAREATEYEPTLNALEKVAKAYKGTPVEAKAEQHLKNMREDAAISGLITRQKSEPKAADALGGGSSAPPEGRLSSAPPRSPSAQHAAASAGDGALCRPSRLATIS